MYSDSRSILFRFKSYTGAALIVGLLVAIAAPGFLWTDWLNSQMFRLGTHLLPVPEEVNNVILIELPKDVYNNPEGISDLRQLIRKLYKAKAQGIAVLMDPLPSLDYQRVEQNDKKKKQAKKKQDESPAWEFTRGELNKLAWTFERYKVKTGIVSQNNQKGYYSFPDKAGETQILPIWQQYWNRVSRSERNILNEKVDGKDYAYKRLPLSLKQYALNKPLLWFEATDGRYIPDLVLSLYANLQADSEISWIENTGIKLATEIIKTNNNAEIFEYFSDLTNRNAEINVLKFSDSLNKQPNIFSKKIIIIGDDKKQLAGVANSLSNLISGATYHAPQLSNWIVTAGLFIVFIFVSVVLPKISKATGILLSVILVLLGLIAQYSLLITEGIWLSLLALYIYLIFGYAIIHLKRITEMRLEHFKLMSHEALWQLAQNQFEKGDHEKALSSLLKCKPTTDVIDLLYEIGLGFERRRQYDKALHLYGELNVRNGNYKDVKKRLKSLSGVSGTQTEMLTPIQAAKTLVMPELGLQLPVFGRYEIEKELGRGAMGVVYLGKDPKINRQVAIKTLDYSQFSESEIKTIKSRFFREAEAAGRLNHPGIVTVYDVGEEEGFAFIAMDFVEGVSLGEFTKTEQLLAVRKVYEIIAEVAETLDYAHSKNIVHRDIKPSNIMYNPKNGQIKITDFGIARITDSVRTRTGSFMGSPSYMAPEQMTGANVDGHADIYALGVSFYQLLTGNLPFDADSIGNLAYKITNEKHQSIRKIRSDLPASATRIVNKALQKKPEKRYSSGKEMADAIRRGMPKDDS